MYHWKAEEFRDESITTIRLVVRGFSYFITYYLFIPNLSSAKVNQMASQTSNSSELLAGSLFNVSGLVALVTGGGSG